MALKTSVDMGNEKKIEFKFWWLQRLGSLQTAPEVQFDLTFETSNLDYPCIMRLLPLTLILVASEAMAASKRPRRSLLASVTSNTYVSMSIWLLVATISRMS